MASTNKQSFGQADALDAALERLDRSVASGREQGRSEIAREIVQQIASGELNPSGLGDAVRRRPKELRFALARALVDEGYRHLEAANESGKKLEAGSYLYELALAIAELRAVLDVVSGMRDK